VTSTVRLRLSESLLSNSAAFPAVPDKP
jgi:hypothetical protein